MQATSASADHFQYLAYDSRNHRLLLAPPPTREPTAGEIIKTVIAWSLEAAALGVSVYAIFFFLGLMAE